MTYFDAIQTVRERIAHFYANHRGRRVELELAQDAMENDCLRAAIDGENTGVLLSLPDYRDSTN